MYGPEDSREAVIDEAVSNVDRGSFTIVEADKAVVSFDFFDADSVYDSYADRNEDCWGEDGPDVSITPEANRELELALAATFETWARKHDAVGTVWAFGTQRNSQYFPAHDEGDTE